jgi:hypothetical protein
VIDAQKTKSQRPKPILQGKLFLSMEKMDKVAGWL